MQLNFGIKLYYNKIKERINWFLFILGLIFSINSYGQNNKTCDEELLGKSFISDGQDHQFLVRYSKPARLYVVFYPQFTYRIAVCCDNKELPVEFKIIDRKGTVQYTNADKNYVRTWDFQFSSIMNAIMELKLATNKIEEKSMRIVIGYQTLKTQ
jgi:hypothetical protein